VRSAFQAKSWRKVRDTGCNTLVGRITLACPTKVFKPIDAFTRVTSWLVNTSGVEAADGQWIIALIDV